MNRVYYVPAMYPLHSYYANVNRPVYTEGFMSRNVPNYDEQVTEAIFNKLKRKASMIELYERLASESPNEESEINILYTLEENKIHLQHLTDLYISYTGRIPDYEVETEDFATYEEGLQKAYERETEGDEYDREDSVQNHHPYVWHVFYRISIGEEENAARLWSLYGERFHRLEDYGTEAFVIDIEEATTGNNTFRTALWTGDYLQVTVMSIDVGDDIGLEIHPDHDQFLRIEEGEGFVQMGDQRDQLDFEENVYDDYAIMVPAGKWHNVTNTGNIPLKLYSIYAPPEHPYGTVHKTKEDAMAAEGNL